MRKRNVSTATLIARIDALRTRHRDISARIESEQTRPAPDSQALSQLKRERLGLKDAIRTTRATLIRSGVRPNAI